MNTKLPDETLLITQLTKGDEHAFKKIYDHYYDLINLFVLKFIKSPHLSEDLTQEIFIKIWEGRMDLTEKESFRAWLFVVARNHTLNFLKKVSRESVGVGEIVRNYQYEHNPIEDEMQEKEYLEKLQQVLDSLPDRTREVFRLCREEDKSYDEVTEILGISRNAVKKHMIRSNKVFKENFKDKLKIAFSFFTF